MIPLEAQLQTLINQMQSDADRIVETWSLVGDAMVKYKTNQDQLLSQLARIFDQGSRMPEPLYAQAPQAPIGQQPQYGLPQHQYYPQQQYPGSGPGVASNGGNGYYGDQGYPPQPYQEQAPAASKSDTPISQLLQNLRRSGNGG